MIKKIIFLLTMVGIMYGQSNLDPKILENLRSKFPNVMDSLDKYEVQILYTQINRDKHNMPHFKEFRFNLDSSHYFYPASTVKLPASILSLEKINRLNIKELNKFSPLEIDSAYPGQIKVNHDSSSENGKLSIAQFIKKVFLVSDNDAFNGLYEFLGQKYFNHRLWEKGYSNVLIQHQFIFSDDADFHKYTNPIKFYSSNKLVYQQDLSFNDEDYSNKFQLKGTIRGRGYYSHGKLINEPMDFSKKNYISLIELNELLKAVIFPDVIDKRKRFSLTKEDYAFLRKYMSMLPRESKFPYYKSDEYYDSYVKYFMFGDSKDPIPGNIRIFNKVGMAYGFLTDVAYVVDFENNIEFLLSAIIHVNNNQIYNDDNYEYDEIGIPFLAELGRMIYDFELKRERKYIPDLSEFKIDYGE